MLGALQNTFRESALLRKGGDALRMSSNHVGWRSFFHVFLAFNIYELRPQICLEGFTLGWNSTSLCPFYKLYGHVNNWYCIRTQEECARGSSNSTLRWVNSSTPTHHMCVHPSLCTFYNLSSTRRVKECYKMWGNNTICQICIGVTKGQGTSTLLYCFSVAVM
jgi:hypothetical protein